MARNVTINGIVYDVPDITFDAICELEENGVELLSLGSTAKIATTVRGLVAWITGMDIRSASKEIEKHIAGGGNIVEIMTAVNDAMQSSGFFSQKTGEEKQQPRPYKPQDHKRKGNQNRNENTDRSPS